MSDSRWNSLIAAIEANHPNLTNQTMRYVGISCARDHAELVTKDKAGAQRAVQGAPEGWQ